MLLLLLLIVDYLLLQPITHEIIPKPPDRQE